MNTHKDTEREFRTKGSQCGGCDRLVSPVSAKCSVTPEDLTGVQD